jgi:hypothetical protein
MPDSQPQDLRADAEMILNGSPYVKDVYDACKRLATAYLSHPSDGKVIDKLLEGCDIPTPEDNNRDRFWCSAILSVGLDIGKVSEIVSKACAMRKDPAVREYFKIMDAKPLQFPDDVQSVIDNIKIHNPFTETDIHCLANYLKTLSRPPQGVTTATPPRPDNYSPIDAGGWCDNCGKNKAAHEWDLTCKTLPERRSRKDRRATP